MPSTMKTEQFFQQNLMVAYVHRVFYMPIFRRIEKSVVLRGLTRVVRIINYIRIHEFL